MVSHALLLKLKLVEPLELGTVHFLSCWDVVLDLRDFLVLLRVDELFDLVFCGLHGSDNVCRIEASLVWLLNSDHLVMRRVCSGAKAQVRIVNENFLRALFVIVAAIVIAFGAIVEDVYIRPHLLLHDLREATHRRCCGACHHQVLVFTQSHGHSPLDVLHGG